MKFDASFLKRSVVYVNATESRDDSERTSHMSEGRWQNKVSWIVQKVEILIVRNYTSSSRDLFVPTLSLKIKEFFTFDTCELPWFDWFHRGASKYYRSGNWETRYWTPWINTITFSLVSFRYSSSTSVYRWFMRLMVASVLLEGGDRWGTSRLYQHEGGASVTGRH